MATVDETVRNSIICYPTSQPNRYAVLDHIFYVVGNGWCWENGEVVQDENGYRPTEPWTPDRDNAQRAMEIERQKPEDREFMRKHLAEFYAELDAENAQVVSEVDVRMYDMTDIEGFEIHPQTPYALLMSLPDDITDDWKAAADEMRAIAITRGWVF